MKAFSLLLVLACSAPAQNSFSSHSGWSFSDTLETTTDVIVADILDGAGLDNGSEVTVKARIRAVRVLQGAIAPGTELAVQWQYQPAPFESPAVTAKVPRVRALWFLRKSGGAGLEPLRAAMPGQAGGFFLEVAPGPLTYPPDAPLEAKIAQEAAASLKDLVTRYPDDFAEHRPQPPVNGVLAPWVQTRTKFEALFMLLESLKPASTLEAYRELSASADPGVRLLGLMGKIGAGETDAILELERDLPHLASSFMAVRASRNLMGLNLEKNFPAAHALGRMALSETSLPGLESAFVMAIGGTHSPEFLPYLIAILGSPDPSARGGALMAFCNLLGPAWNEREKPRGLWIPEMAAYCPSGVPMNDRQQEERDIQFWKQWWEANRAEIGKTTTLPLAAAPARYNAPQNFRQITDIPLEAPFDGILRMLDAQATHYHDDAGAIVAAPPPVHDPVAGRLSPPDREAWSKAVEAIQAKLAANQKRSLDLMNAARLQGAMPPREKLAALYQERRAILSAGLEDLRNMLSPDGWQALERMMKNTGMVMVEVTEPPK